MCVDDIEFLEARNLHHFARKSRGVQREFEKGIGGHLDFVIEDVSLVSVESHRHCIADEVDLVTLESKGFTEFGGNYSTASVCWVTNDADFHIW
jgi:hypothetical protein